jgi:hypothetical protein
VLLSELIQGGSVHFGQVMAMGILLGKKYTKVKYVCVGMITAGVAIFVYNKVYSHRFLYDMFVTLPVPATPLS